jgi:hypothetical protein
MHNAKALEMCMKRFGIYYEIGKSIFRKYKKFWEELIAYFP